MYKLDDLAVDVHFFINFVMMVISSSLPISSLGNDKLKHVESDKKKVDNKYFKNTILSIKPQNIFNKNWCFKLMHKIAFSEVILETNINLNRVLYILKIKFKLGSLYKN